MEHVLSLHQSNIVHGDIKPRNILLRSLEDSAKAKATDEGVEPGWAVVLCDLDCAKLVEEVYQRGIRRLIVLDLAGVGVSAGVPTIDLCQEIKAAYPDLEIWTGGGVRSIADVQKLDAVGIDGVLVASALHDGKITPMDWKNL